MSGALEGRRLEDNKPLRIPMALPDSREFCGQRWEKAASNSPNRRVVPPRGHHCQGSSSGLPRLVGFDPPTEARSIVGVYPFPINTLDPPVLPRGYIPGRSPAGPSPSSVLSFFSPVVVVLFTSP